MSHPFSIWSAFDVDLSPEDMVLALEDRGLTVCELSDEHGAMLLEREGSPEEIGGAFRAFSEKHGVSFPQGHLWLRVQLCRDVSETVATLDRWFRLFGAIGIRNAVLHPDTHFPEGTDREEIMTQNTAVLKQLVPLAEKAGIRLCLENISKPFEKAEGLLELIERAGGSPVLGICLDTGHLHIHDSGSQKSFILAAGSRLHALHIADNQGTSDQHMMPFGRGSVDFSEVMTGLKAIGYCDLFNYEIPGERDCPMVLRKAKTEYLKAVTDYLFSL